MEDDAFGRCYVTCMNRCADDCRRNPAICPGARGLHHGARRALLRRVQARRNRHGAGKLGI